MAAAKEISMGAAIAAASRQVLARCQYRPFRVKLVKLAVTNLTGPLGCDRFSPNHNFANTFSGLFPR